MVNQSHKATQRVELRRLLGSVGKDRYFNHEKKTYFEKQTDSNFWVTTWKSTENVKSCRRIWGNSMIFPEQVLHQNIFWKHDWKIDIGQPKPQIDAARWVASITGLRWSRSFFQSRKKITFRKTNWFQLLGHSLEIDRKCEVMSSDLWKFHDFPRTGAQTCFF